MNKNKPSPPFEAYSGNSPYMFISYSHQDMDRVYLEIEKWHTKGYNIWYDEGIRPTKVWPDEIAKNIENCALFIVFISPHSVSSRNVENEINFALERQKPILPIHLEETSLPSGIKLRMGDIQAILKYELSIETYQLRIKHLFDAFLTSNFANKKNDGNDHQTENKNTIIFDSSYRQSEWIGCPTADLGLSHIAEELSQSYSVINYKEGYSSISNFPPKATLVLPTPFETMVSDDEHEHIANWVYKGGKLLTFGIYLMEAHHYGNHNRLMRRFGLEFQKDLIVPNGKEDYSSCMKQSFAFQDQDLWIVSKPEASPSDHPIIKDVGKIALTSSCTIATASKPLFMISTSETVAIMTAFGFQNPEGRLRRITDYKLDKRSQAPFMAAMRYGSGKVIGVGSWKVFLNDLVQAYPEGNNKLLQNSIAWLASES
jgi:hypothetical protein